MIEIFDNKVGDALKLIHQRLSDDIINQKLVEEEFIQSAPNTFDLLKQISEEWDKALKDNYKDCWKELLKEDWSRVNVVDEKEYKDVEIRLEKMKWCGDEENKGEI